MKIKVFALRFFFMLSFSLLLSTASAVTDEFEMPEVSFGGDVQPVSTEKVTVTPFGEDMVIVTSGSAKAAPSGDMSLPIVLSFIALYISYKKAKKRSRYYYSI